jgi:hypothetical protein
MAGRFMLQVKNRARNVFWWAVIMLQTMRLLIFCVARGVYVGAKEGYRIWEYNMIRWDRLDKLTKGR